MEFESGGIVAAGCEGDVEGFGDIGALAGNDDTLGDGALIKLERFRLCIMSDGRATYLS